MCAFLWCRQFWRQPPFKAASALALLLTLTACHHPLAYNLHDRIVTPPPSKPEIKHARQHPATKTGCDIQSGSVSLTWHGSTAQVAIEPAALQPPGTPRPQAAVPGVTVTETSARIPVDYLDELEKFRDALAASEDSGCLHSAEDTRLLESIVETLPLPDRFATFLRYGGFFHNGFIDLIPGFVLKVVTPTGAAPDVSIYEVTRSTLDGPSQIILASGVGKAFDLPTEPAWFRYLYWTGGSRPFRTTILGVDDRNTLHATTTSFFQNPENFCASPSPEIAPHISFCQSIAVTVGMNAGFYVKLDGQNFFVRLGATVGEALRDANPRQRPGQMPPRVQSLRRLYRGKLIPVTFDPAANTILGVFLMPGDEILTGTASQLNR